VFSNSISDLDAVSRNEVWFLPKGISFQAYKVLSFDKMIPRAYLNTIIYCTVATVICLFLTGLIAYPLSIRTLRGRALMTVLLVIPMFIEGGLIPTVLTVRAYGLMDTLWALVLPSAVGLFYVVIVRTNFQALPDSLRESAYIDGASHIRILLQIYMPLSKAIFATLALWVVVKQWNSFFAPLIYLVDSRKYPLQLVLRKLIVEQVMRGGFESGVIEQEGAENKALYESLKMAAIIVSIGPIIFVYPFVQKYFIKGVLIGSIKG
jgi:putative aldouronate transport system permease protein